MPSTDDFYNRLGDTNNILSQVETDLTAVKASVDTVNSTLQAGFAELDSTLQNGFAELNTTLLTGFSELVTIGNYTNEALYQNSQQNDTIICILEHISKDVCELLNEAAVQTRLQTSIEKSSAALTDLYARTHAEAALQREKDQALLAQIERCCPPPPIQPPCSYEPCPAPRPLPGPPDVVAEGQPGQPQTNK